MGVIAASALNSPGIIFSQTLWLLFMSFFSFWISWRCSFRLSHFKFIFTALHLSVSKDLDLEVKPSWNIEENDTEQSQTQGREEQRYNTKIIVTNTCVLSEQTSETNKM